MYFIAWIGEEPVGHVELEFPNERSPARLAEYGDPPFVRDLAVDEEHRRRGAGRALMLALEDEAREGGLELLQLQTGSGEGYAAARALYEDLGYEAVDGSLHILSARIPGREGSESVFLEILTTWRKRLV